VKVVTWCKAPPALGRAHHACSVSCCTCHHCFEKKRAFSENHNNIICELVVNERCTCMQAINSVSTARSTRPFFVTKTKPKTMLSRLRPRQAPVVGPRPRPFPQDEDLSLKTNTKSFHQQFKVHIHPKQAGLCYKYAFKPSLSPASVIQNSY